MEAPLPSPSLVGLNSQLLAELLEAALGDLLVALDEHLAGVLVDDVARRDLAHDLGCLDRKAVDAAVLVRGLDGAVLAGARLTVDVALPPGFSLPAVPRDRRAAPRRRGGDGPWLPAVDQEGSWSLSVMLVEANTLRSETAT